MGDFGESFFEDGGELEELEGVIGGGCVEDDGFVREGFNLFEDFGEGYGFVDIGDLDGMLVWLFMMKFFLVVCIVKVKFCIILFILFLSVFKFFCFFFCLVNRFCMFLFGLIFMVFRLLNLFISFVFLLNFWEKVLLRL